MLREVLYFLFGLPYEFISQHVSQFYGLPIPQRLPLQFAGKIGYAVAPPLFIVQLVNDFLHGVTGADDLRLDFVSDT